MVNNAHIRTEDLQLWFGKKKILKNITMPIYDKKITALIGPSGCGKSTLLRCFNRMNDLSTDVKIAGKVYLNEKDILQMIDLQINHQEKIVLSQLIPFQLLMFFPKNNQVNTPKQ
jgi:phosphate transport system ATP-binding protein